MKYLHFMVDQFYSEEFIALVHSYFNIEEHFFIIIKEKNKKMHIDPEKFHNVRIFKFKGNFLTRFFTIRYTTIRKLMKQAENIFIHYLTEEVSGILFGFRGKAKIIWIIWGADLYKYLPIQLYDKLTLELISKLDGKFKSTLKKYYFFFKYEIRRMLIKRIDYVISPHKGDVRLLRKYFKTKAEWYSQAIYPNPVEYEKLDVEGDHSNNEEYNFKKKGSKIFLLGNSGSPSNNHLDIMLKLSKMNDKNYIIICPLSYGSQIYINKIVEKGKVLFGNRFIPLLEFLKPDVYSYILKQIDVAVMYHNRQQGMGSVHLLAYLGKLICMKKTSGYFDLVERGVTLFSTQELEKLISNEIEFTEESSKNNKQILTQYFSKNSVISSIEILLNLLETRNTR